MNERLYFKSTFDLGQYRFKGKIECNDKQQVMILPDCFLKNEIRNVTEAVICLRYDGAAFSKKEPGRAQVD